MKDKDDLIIILKMKLDGSKEKVKERDELIKESIEVIKYYGNRMDSGGTARRYLEKAKKLVGELK